MSIFQKKNHIQIVIINSKQSLNIKTLTAELIYVALKALL